MSELDRLAASRRRADERARRAYDALLDEVIRLLRAPADDNRGNVRELARRAGIAHGTIYNELERRRRAQDGTA